MNVERDKKILSFITIATLVIVFVLVIGIVIFSLPDTTDEFETQTETQTEADAGTSTRYLDDVEATVTQALGESISDPVSSLIV